MTDKALYVSVMGGHGRGIHRGASGGAGLLSELARLMPGARPAACPSLVEA